MGRSSWPYGAFLRTFCAAVVLAGVLVVAPAQAAQGGTRTPTITEFSIPAGDSRPMDITRGPDGALWFTEFGAGKIGRISVSGEVREYTVPTSSSGPGYITTGPDHALWFTEWFGNKVGRITTTGRITEFPLPTPGSLPASITAGRDGAVWFTEFTGNRIGRVTSDGRITEYVVPTPAALPFGFTIAPGCEGLWFGETTQVSCITTDGQITEHPIMHPPSSLDPEGPYGLATGPDGAIWFTVQYSGMIGRMIGAAPFTVTERALPPGTIASAITVGPDGALWFNEAGSNKIGRMTMSGTVTEQAIPTSNPPAPVGGIAVGPDRALWFTEFHAGKIGRLIPQD